MVFQYLFHCKQWQLLVAEADKAVAPNASTFWSSLDA